MNKDEMIKDLKRDYKLCVTCEMFNGWVDESGNIHDAGCLEYLNCDCNATNELANILFNANCRILADDEFVLNQIEIDELRKDQAEVKFLKNKIKQETAREILQELADYTYEDINGQVTVDWDYLETLAEKYGFYLR